MAKRKKKKKSWFGFGSAKKRRRKTVKSTSRLWSVFLILAAVCVVAAIAVGFVYIDRYVQAVSPVAQPFGRLELVGVPDWAGSELLEKIASTAGGKEFCLDKTVAKEIATSLQSMAWLYDVRARTTSKTIRISANYRKPIALVQKGGEKFYLDKDGVLLDYLATGKLPIVKITGIQAGQVAPVGSIWRQDDVAAAVKVLGVLGRMDEISTPQKPLLYEIASMDVANLGGRKNNRQSHIILYAKDGTQILWGAAPGEAERYLEATEKEKIAMLYEFYKQHRTVQGIVKYIELRQPQKTMPRPLD